MKAADVYLNNAGTSYPKPDAVLDAAASTLRAAPSSYGEIYERSLSTVAAALGMKNDRLLFTSSCTQALDVAILSLPWQEGDRIVTSSLEHSAVMRPLHTLSRLSGVTHQRVPYRPGLPFDLEYLESTLAQGKARLVVLSAASNVTGEVLPFEEASKMAHDHGAVVLLDAAQVVGLFDLNVETLGVDLLTFAGHKNPLGVQGIGGLWAKESVGFDCNDAVCEIGDAGPLSKSMPGYCDVGGLNLAALASLAAGLTVWGSERARRMQRAIALAAAFAEAARDVKKVKVFGHHGGAQTATISFLHSALPLSQADGHFSAHGVRLRVGTHCAPDALRAIGAGEGTIRISFGPQNTQEDLEVALRALRAIR